MLALKGFEQAYIRLPGGKGCQGQAIKIDLQQLENLHDLFFTLQLARSGIGRMNI